MASKGGGKSSDRRAGKRRDRNHRVGTRIPELGYYLIVTDTEETEKNDINAGWSNPCFEIWMYAYFGEMPAIRESFTCCNRFAEKFEKVTGQKYLKKDKDIYRKMVQYGDSEKAIILAEQKWKQCIDDGKWLPSKMWPMSTVYRLVREILSKL